MRHLYVRIYIAIILILVLFGLLSSIAWWLGPGQERRHEHLVGGLTRLAQRALPGADAPVAETRQVLDELAAGSGVDLTLLDAERNLIANVGAPIKLKPDRTPGWIRPSRHGPTLALRLLDGRWLVGRPQRLGRGHGARWLWSVLLLAVAVAIGAYPLAKRITRRLRRLQHNVELLGAGDFGARVEVEGRDEVASLAQSFNHAAQKIEELVNSQRSMLASASHELRSPLARIRVAIELLGTQPRSDLADRITEDVAELDGLIDELLLASRLEAGDLDASSTRVDMLAVAAEECTRVGASFSGEPQFVEADPKLMHRLLRNLLQNAVRHGGGTDIEVEIGRADEETVLIRVSDRGPGIAEHERERIFDAFYRPRGMRESGEGVGLGLALVRQIAERYDGTVRYLPRTGGGSRFELRLPPASD